jgi:hypothetical protein
VVNGAAVVVVPGLGRFVLQQGASTSVRDRAIAIFVLVEKVTPHGGVTTGLGGTALARGAAIRHGCG